MFKKIILSFICLFIVIVGAIFYYFGAYEHAFAPKATVEPGAPTKVIYETPYGQNVFSTGMIKIKDGIVFLHHNKSNVIVTKINEKTNQKEVINELQTKGRINFQDFSDNKVLIILPRKSKEGFYEELVVYDYSKNSFKKADFKISSLITSRPDKKELIVSTADRTKILILDEDFNVKKEIKLQKDIEPKFAKDNTLLLISKSGKRQFIWGTLNLESGKITYAPYITEVLKSDKHLFVNQQVLSSGDIIFKTVDKKGANIVVSYNINTNEYKTIMKADNALVYYFLSRNNASFGNSCALIKKGLAYYIYDGETKKLRKMHLSLFPAVIDTIGPDKLYFQSFAGSFTVDLKTRKTYIVGVFPSMPSKADLKTAILSNLMNPYFRIYNSDTNKYTQSIFHYIPAKDMDILPLKNGFYIAYNTYFNDKFKTVVEKYER